MRRRPLPIAAGMLTCLPLCLAAALAACSTAPAASASERLTLAGPWAFQPGDDVRWAAPDFDDRGWTQLDVPGSWRRQGFGSLTGMAWYRRRAHAPWPPHEPLAVTLGKIDSAYELYAGGRLLGGVGALPPAPRMEYDRHRTYFIPPAAREADGSLVLAIRVWRNPLKSSSAAGPVEGPFEIGLIGPLVDRQNLAEAQQLALLLVFLLVAIYHFSLRIRLGSGADYAWFGALALLAALYGFLRTQWKYLVLDDFLLLKKIEHTALWLVPAVMLQFLWTFFREPPPRWLRVVQGVLIAGALTVALAPGLRTPLAVLPWLQMSVVPLLAVSIALVIRRIGAGDREARLVGLGMAILGAAIVHDALVDRNVLINPRIAIYGFAVLVVGMSVTLGNRFQRALRDRELLLQELEARVESRTRELSDAYREMERLALRDSVTHLMNRRAIAERAASELARARRHQSPFAVAMIDVDHFKAVNDTQGHTAGDEALAEVARRLAEAVRASDDVGRWGGEEFLVLMPGADHTEAAAAGERLRGVVAAAPMMTGGAPRTITVSVGVAAVDGAASACDLDTLIRHADEALYRAKADGRNAVRVGDVASLDGTGI